MCCVRPHKLAASDVTCFPTNTNVVIPEFGICQVPQLAAVGAKEKAAYQPEAPLTSLTLCLQARSDGVGQLFHRIGWSLQELSLIFSWQFYGSESDAHAVLPTILMACPNLTSLTLRSDRDINLDWFATMYDSLGDAQLPILTSLKFRRFRNFGEGDGSLLAEQLGDPTTRLGRHLK